MIETGTLENLGLLRQPELRNPTTQGTLQQENFLELMVAQFSNQDPFQPLENGDFLGQLAQFGTVSGIEELQQSFQQMADSLFSDQALQASSLIGREVLVPGSVGQLGDGGLRGAVELAAPAQNLEVRVLDASGAQVAVLDLGGQGAGLANFSWDGRLADGTQAPRGAYTLQAFATDSAAGTQVPVLVGARVDSVALGAGGGVRLEVNGLGELPLSEVRRIGN
ncbi:MAG: flagellar hook assembly protein FlgD [Pseudomonadota bacterium]